MSDDPGQTASDGSAAARDRRSLPLDRFNAFSDGVFAIAITLLVLELTVPPEGVPLLAALREQWPEFVGYYISFAFIGGIWITHSGLTKYMKLGDTVVYSQYGGSEIKVDEVEYKVLSDDDLLAVLE